VGQINIAELPYEPSGPERLFFLFLFFAVCFILVRVTRVAWRLWSFRGRREFSSYANDNVQEIAKAALKGQFVINSKRSESEKICDRLFFIDVEFLFLWETCCAKIQSTKILAAITAVLSFSVAALGCVNICIGMTTEADVGLAAVGGAGRVVFALLASGLFVSAFFYSLSLLLQTTLDRRRRDWNYFRARITKELDSGQMHEKRTQ
jgi:hypothetical protein